MSTCNIIVQSVTDSYMTYDLVSCVALNRLHFRDSRCLEGGVPSKHLLLKD